MIISRYLYGMRGVLAQLAVISALSCVSGASLFLQRFQAHSYLSVALVSFCAGVVVVVFIVWVVSIHYWQKTTRMEEEYWHRLNTTSHVIHE
jgi:hypothetical protein